MTKKRELFVSVDVEASGPIPGEYSLLSIGACNVDKPDQTFLCELKPVSRKADPKALEKSGFSLEKLEKSGRDPELAMESFAAWLESLRSANDSLVFVGFQCTLRLVIHKLLLS